MNKRQSLNKDWETASFAALMFSIRKYSDRLSEKHGYKLNSRSREIDVRIIDKLHGSKQRIDNAIAYIFERHNLVELKNPREELNIDVFWKGISYAAQYKSNGRDDTTNKEGVNIKPMNEITLTFLRVSKPVELFKYLRANSYNISQKFPGVYYITGIPELKIQVVVGSELEGDEYIPLRVQKENASEEDIRKFIEMCGEMKEQSDKDMADTIMQVSISNNKKIYEKIKKEDSEMCKALENLMEDRIAIRVNEGILLGEERGIAIGEARGRAEGIRSILELLTSSGKLTAQEASALMASV